MTTSTKTTKTERPECPQGHTGNVAVHGRFVRSDGQFSRPRFRCYPDDGSTRHTFSLPRRQPTVGNPHGMSCDHCEREYGLADGPRAIREYSQTINEIAGVLVAIGSGSPLRVASRDGRQSARRFTLGAFPLSKETARKRRDFSSRQNILAARYLDAYGPAILDRVLPTHWPRLLILDSKPLKMRPYGAVEWEDWGSSLPGGALLAAAGRDDEAGIARSWRISFGATETKESWLRFFDELEGEPEWVVIDRAPALEAAVSTRWPKATIFYCAFHLAKNLIEAAYHDGVYFEESPFVEAIRAAFHSTDEWKALRDLAVGQPNIERWMTENESLIRHQIDLRTAFPKYPRSNGAAETTLRTVDGYIGKRRRNFRNARRLNAMLGLMTANARGVSDAITYANIVRELSASPPSLSAGMDHGALVNDPSVKTHGSIADLLLAAAGIKVDTKRAYDVSAKARSVQTIADGFNAERAKIGISPIEVHISAGGTASVSVKNKMLTDFPEFAAEWDTAKNGRGPEDVPAGHWVESWWICDAGHSWQSQAGKRIGRLLRCQHCVTNRADASNSLAAIHPLLLAFWDDAANLPLTPQTIRATYSKAVMWRCLEGLGHPIYKASIRRQSTALITCPLCSKMRPASTRTTRKPTIYDDIFASAPEYALDTEVRLPTVRVQSLAKRNTTVPRPTASKVVPVQAMAFVGRSEAIEALRVLGLKGIAGDAWVEAKIVGSAGLARLDEAILNPAASDEAKILAGTLLVLAKRAGTRTLRFRLAVPRVG